MRKKFPGLADGYAVVMAGVVVGLMPRYRMSAKTKTIIMARYRSARDIESFINDIEDGIDKALRFRKSEQIDPCIKYRGRSWHRSLEVNTRVKIVGYLTKTYTKYTGRRAGYSFSYKTGQPGGPFVDLLEIIYQDAKFYRTRETIKMDIRRFRSGR